MTEISSEQTRMEQAAIEQAVRQWQAFLEDESDSGLVELLADDVVFHSPVVYSPQRGKSIVAGYLAAAKQSLARGPARTFRYTGELFGVKMAILEFETMIGSTYVNGIDIIHCDSAGRIVEFKVLVRPLQAVEAVHERMRTLASDLG